MNEKRKEVNNIVEKNNVNVIIIPDVYLESPKYNLTRYRNDNDDTGNKASYDLSEKKAEELHSFENEKKAAKRF
jgi:ribonuclease E